MHNTFWFATDREQWDGWLRKTVEPFCDNQFPPPLDPNCCSAVFNAETERDMRAMYVDKSGICSNGML